MVSTNRHSNRSFYILVGVLNLAVAMMFYVVTMHIAAASPVFAMSVPVVPAEAPIKQGIPTHLSIPSLAIDLPVGTGSYDQTDATWFVDLSKAYYADMSVPINDHNGTTLIYGHAQTPVFLRLLNIQPGSQAVVTTDTGYLFHYTYQSMIEVLPSDMSVFQANGPPTLTLQTCMGSWDAYRGMFSFKLDSVGRV